MENKFKSACNKYIEFRKQKIQPTDINNLQKIYENMWGIINSLEEVSKVNNFIIERNKELPIEIYLYHVEHLLISLNQNRGQYNPLTDEEWKHCEIMIYLLRKINALDPLHDSRKLITNLFTFLYHHNKDQNPKKNLDIMKEILYISPHSIPAHYYIGRLYKFNKDLLNSVFHLKLTIEMIDSLPSMDDFMKKIKSMSLIELGHIYYKDVGISNRYLALYYYKRAYEIDPESPEACNCVAVIYTELREVDNALKYYELGFKCVENPSMNSVDGIKAQLYMNMGLVKSFETKYEEAIECSNNAIKYNPKLALAYQNKLLDLNYISYKLKDPMYIANQHFKINKMYDKIITDYKESIPNYIIKNKKDILNIGFISGDFAYHPVSYFIYGILKYFDKTKINIFGYYSKSIQIGGEFPDIKFKCIQNESPEVVAQVIKNDKIDILIDLSGHTGENRLDVFVLKPAPIQMTYLGYPNTTGLKNMDYRISDKIADGQDSEKYHSEKLLYMPKCFLNYNFIYGNENLKEIKSRDHSKNIVFGSFNKCNKINEQVIRVWTRILKEIPNSVLVLKTKEFQTKSLKDNFMKNVEKFQGDVDLKKRILFLPYVDNWLDHFDDYNKMDYALDSFPYSGTTTTCDALNMGVPVITLYDDVKHFHSQNVSASILKNSGLSKYITYSEDEYVELAKKLARDVEKLDKHQIRKAFQEGHVCNREEFVNDFQNLLVDTYHSHFLKL